MAETPRRRIAPRQDSFESGHLSARAQYWDVAYGSIEMLGIASARSRVPRGERPSIRQSPGTVTVYDGAKPE